MLAARSTPMIGTTPVRRSQNPEHGFVLFELMLALLIVGLLAGLVLPWASARGSASEARSLASRIAVLLRADRNAALRGGQPVVSAIDVTAGSIRSGVGSGMVRVPPSYRIDASASLARGVRFDPDGKAQGGEIALLSAKAQDIVLRIDPISAAVEVREGRGPHGR